MREGQRMSGYTDGVSLLAFPAGLEIYLGMSIFKRLLKELIKN